MAATTNKQARESRAVLRRIEPGNGEACRACGEIVRFKAKLNLEQVICNVYADRRWLRVEHFHADCYTTAGAPHGPVV
ncbi:hypothetical protein BH20ACT2_BH20ACT2_08190 [soil metagenome]